MAAASKRFGHARGKKVVKEIRGGLPEQYSNKGFCWSFIGLFIVCVFFGILLCREGTGICETVIGIGFMYLVVLYIYLRFSVSYVIDESGVTITYINFKIWTVHFNWDEYYEVEFGTTRTPWHDQIFLRQQPILLPLNYTISFYALKRYTSTLNRIFPSLYTD